MFYKVIIHILLYVDRSMMLTLKWLTYWLADMMLIRICNGSLWWSGPHCRVMAINLVRFGIIWCTVILEWDCPNVSLFHIHDVAWNQPVNSSKPIYCHPNDSLSPSVDERMLLYATGPTLTGSPHNRLSKVNPVCSSTVCVWPLESTRSLPICRAVTSMTIHLTETLHSCQTFLELCKHICVIHF